jgi:hypothetical protein
LSANEKPAGEAGFPIQSLRGDYICFEQSLFGHSK